MTAQLSPMRTGRITASRVGAIIGVNKYQTRDDVMREMVRDALGAEPEFVGNAATEWGNEHEDDARSEYEREHGVLVLDAQEFVQHPEHEWLGVSPDGLLGADGMAEFKCPYWAKYTSIEAKPEYQAQVQLQLACTGRDWCAFVIWRPDEPLIVERVERDPDWLPTHLATLAEFHAEYERIVADPELAAPYLDVRERDDPDWAAAASRLYVAQVMLDDAAAMHEQARQALLDLAGDRAARGCGVSVTRSERAGSVDWKKLASKHAPDADPDEFRRPSSVVTTVRVVKDES